MKAEVQTLKRNDISSEVFIIAPTQIDAISKQFGEAVAEAMKVRSLSQKIQQIAAEILIKTLTEAKNTGEQ